jgi:tetratricopeptide (TPR) repeat protein
VTVLVGAALLVKYFQPPDIAGQHIAVASSYFQKGDLTNALSEFQAALKSDPNRAEAKRGVANIKDILEARDTLASAEREAAAENYDKAKDLCYRVLRNFPNYGRALELQAVIKSIENAKIAFAARNWNDAIRLLEKAQEAYPKSELIRLRLEQVQRESAAEAGLTRANDALQHQQPDMAQPLLESIPTNSVYFIEARQALDGISRGRRLQKSLADAQSYYRGGNIPDALGAIASGLQQSADNALLLDLQNHIRAMALLMKPVDAALGEAESINSLLEGEKACEDAIAFEKDPLNALRKRAQSTETALGEKLVRIAQSSAARAGDMLQSGDRKGALRQYDQAVKATPGDQNLLALRDKLRLEIVADCRASYQKAIVYEELGQKDLAKASYQEVLNTGLPGDDYYERANRKLQTLTQ